MSSILNILPLGGQYFEPHLYEDSHIPKFEWIYDLYYLLMTKVNTPEFDGR